MGFRQGALEGLVVNLFSGIYRGRKVLLTGHTGFKGSWLALWLTELGARVTGVSLDPESSPNHWELLELAADDRRLDIRDANALKNIISEVKPEIVFHLAAQPLVRRSYADPLMTWETNVMGTANILEACRHVSSVQTIIVMTTDKCYLNREWHWGYRENDRLGGHDPYSASKAATELLVASYRDAFFAVESAPLLATVRAGNVIGGGDWSKDRLVPDLVRAVSEGESLEVRSPNATRPWQHVLESLSGCLLLGQKLLERNREMADAWNFGPDDTGNMHVKQVLELMGQSWDALQWHENKAPQPHEANLLHLDSTKARHVLQWLPVWDLPQCLKQTSLWYRRFLADGSLASREQLAAYVEAARLKGLAWTS